MSAFVWGLLSRIPGTRQHRRYECVCGFVADVDDFMDALSPGYPRFPSPIPRHPEMCRLSVEAMDATLRSVKAGAEGGDALAVFQEHFPVV